MALVVTRCVEDGNLVIWLANRYVHVKRVRGLTWPACTK